MRTNRAHRRADVLPRNSDGVTKRDDSPGGFTRVRIALERIVMDTLFNLESPDRFGGVSGFVNVSWHKLLYSFLV